MKKITLLLALLPAAALAQQHFSGIGTSSRTSFYNAAVNPAELANISTRFEANVIGLSINASSNKAKFSDLISGKDLEDRLFEGDDPTDLRIDAEVAGPALSYKTGNWVFGFSTRAYGKLDLVDVDANIGDAITRAGVNSIAGSTTISNDYNQRLNGTTWGEVGLSAATALYENESHRLTAGATFKLLFPGSYANFGADSFSGTINNTLGNATLTNTQANLNIAYSGNLGEDFTDFGDYARSMFGKLNGVAADIGIAYRWKDAMEPDPRRYRLKGGLSVRNIGSMKFSSTNNASTNYALSIQGAESLNLNQFQDVTSLEQVESMLLASGYLDRTENQKMDFKVKLPTVFQAYADIRLVPDLFVTLYTQQKLSDGSENDQINTENIISVTPRYLISQVELFTPLASNEIAGFTAGLGIRAYGFFAGSSSVLSALINDSRQADAFIGYCFSLN